MNNAKFRYFFKHLETGDHMWFTLFLGEIEFGAGKDLIKSMSYEGYVLTNRDQFTSLCDGLNEYRVWNRSGVEVYENDVVEYTLSPRVGDDYQERGVVQYRDGRYLIVRPDTLLVNDLKHALQQNLGKVIGPAYIHAPEEVKPEWP